MDYVFNKSSKFPKDLIKKNYQTQKHKNVSNFFNEKPTALTYQIFYESLEKSKRALKKPVVGLTSLKQPTIVGNKVFSFRPPKIIKKERTEDSLNESKNTIKDIVFNDEVLGFFDENSSGVDYDNDKLLKELAPADNRKRQNFIKKEEKITMDKPENKGLYDYINLDGFPYYSQENNLILLKASSLFENSVLMENNYFVVHCKTKYISQDLRLGVSILLTFKPKKPGLVLSTHIPPTNKLKVFPPLILNQHFSKSITQEFTLNTTKKTEIVDFPKLQVSVTEAEKHREQFFIPLPFSVNKFRVNIKNDIDSVFDFLNNSNEIFKDVLKLNKKIIDGISQLKEIFPGVVKIDEETYVDLVRFNREVRFLIKFKTVGEGLMEIKLFTDLKDTVINANYIKWIFWIFAEP